MESPLNCECCGKKSIWWLLAEEYKYACGACVEEDQVKLCEYTGYWRITAECVCGRVGPVNYDNDQYWCGSGPRCCP